VQIIADASHHHNDKFNVPSWGVGVFAEQGLHLTLTSGIQSSCGCKHGTEAYSTTIKYFWSL
jgi:hypothetical protein